MPIQLLEPAACLDEALLVHRSSTSSWESAAEYFHEGAGVALSSSQQGVDPGIKLRSLLPLPPAFTTQIEDATFSSFMGLFPQINRAWLTVDSNIFLWSYGLLNGSSIHNNDLYVYEGISQIIVSIALVTPRPGVFVDSVKHLIAVATSVEVTLLGVSFSPTGEINLLPTNISVATDGVHMLKLHSAPNGRLFMAGSDGCLHEFSYEAGPHSSLLDLISGRPPKRARKLVHTPASFLSYVIPASVKAVFTKNDELVDLVIDHHRNILFTLSQSGHLSMYEVADGNPARLVTRADLAHMSRNYMSLSVPPGAREYVSIHTVNPSMSDAVHLIVVTTFGERIYFSTRSGSSILPSSGSSRSASRPMATKGLRCIGYRPCPDRLLSRSSRPFVHIAWCEAGTAVFADLRDGESDRLVSIFPEASVGQTPGSRIDSRSGSPRPVEIVFETQLDTNYEGMNVVRSPGRVTPGRTPNLHVPNSDSKIPKRTFAIVGSSTDMSEVQNLRHEARMGSPTLFWVLSASAMHLYERVQPIVRLKEILGSGGGAASDIQAFFGRHGAAETCAMCLEVGITTPSLQSAAAKVFYNFGVDLQHDRREQPSIPYGQHYHGSDGRRRPSFGAEMGRSGRMSRSAFDIGRPSLQPVPRFSGAHDGTSLYLAKIVHPVWNEYITTNRSHEGYQSLTSSKEQLDIIRNSLLAVIGFLNEYTPEAMLPETNNDESNEEMRTGGRASSRPVVAKAGNTAGLGNDRSHQGAADTMFRETYPGQSNEARRTELSSISALKNLSIRTTEALALLSITADHQLHRLFMSMPDAARKVLAGMRLCELVVSDNGSAVAASLIEAIFASYADASNALDRVGRILQDMCPGFFGNSDVDLHRGLAILRQTVDSVVNAGNTQGLGLAALDASSMEVVHHSAEEAARILKMVPDRIADIRAVCDDFKKLGVLPLLVDLALTIGKVAEAVGKQDRADVAYAAIFDALGPVIHGYEYDGQGMRDVPGSEESLHNTGLRDAAIRVAWTSGSEAFMYKLYDFLLQSKRGEEMLLQHSSPSLEKFLEERKALSLLWKHCAAHGKHYEAAGILFTLAESENEVSLADRLNSLSSALHNAKAATSKGDSRAASLLNEISVLMDVAKVQLRVREELVRQHSGGAEVEEAIRELDGPILDLSTLFNKYARRFALFEASLEALRCGGYRDDAYVRGLWFEILEREESSAGTPAVMRQRLLSLGREFYPSDVAFPTGYIIDLLERMLYKKRLVPSWEGAIDWASSTMKSIGVPLSDLVDGYRRMIEDPQQASAGEIQWSWTEENAQLHLLKATEKVISMWASERKDGNEIRGSGQFYSHGRRSSLSECDKVLRAITLCKSRLRGMSSMTCAALVQQFEMLEKRVAPLIQ